MAAARGAVLGVGLYRQADVLPVRLRPRPPSSAVLCCALYLGEMYEIKGQQPPGYQAAARLPAAIHGNDAACCKRFVSAAEFGVSSSDSALGQSAAV